MNFDQEPWSHRTGSLGENPSSRKPEQIPPHTRRNQRGATVHSTSLPAGLTGTICSARWKVLPAKLARIRPLR